MHFRLDLHSGAPLGQQIVRQVRLAVAAGRLVAGEKLPSARDLAEELGVNFHTVRTAYSLLETQGVLRTDRGKGTFVAESPNRLDEQALEQLVREHAERLAADLAGMGLSLQQVEALLRPALRNCFPTAPEKAPPES